VPKVPIDEGCGRVQTKRSSDIQGKFGPTGATENVVDAAPLAVGLLGTVQGECYEDVET
jgi:hypothetical protein